MAPPLRCATLRVMVPVARRNLLADKGRLVMSVAGVAFALLLVLVVVALYRGWSEASSLFEELPGDLWVAERGTTDPFRSQSLLPAGSGPDLAAIAGVAAVRPVYARRLGFPHEGRDLDVFFLAIDTPPGAPVPAEARARFLPARGDVVVDEVLAGEAGLAVGDTLRVFGRPLRVSAVRPGGNPIFQLAFLSGADGRALLGRPGKVGYFLLALEPGADARAVARRAAAAVPGSEVDTSEAFAASMSSLVDQGFLPVVGVLVGVGLVIGGAVVALTTYTATIEKARDFGVLKAVGASNGFVYRIVVWQGLIVGVAGAALGIAAAAGATRLIGGRVPEFVTVVRPADAAVLFALTVAVSVAAAVVPALRINRIDPAIVFRA